ncbi:MAG: protease pro-enzyme activation domain-containing protein [Candidatus Sulfotelmatobacter sp.]
MRFWKFLLPLLASSLCFAAPPDRITGPIDSSQMVMLRNHVSPFAQSRNDQGLIEPGYSLNITMLFTQTPAQQAALQKLLADQQNPKSAKFHQWLSPEQYAERFGLSTNDIDKITAWLASQGFKVVYVARGRDSLTFSGNAAQAQSVLKTEIHRYEVDGKAHFANSAPPMIPAALSGIVGGFRGLHNFFPHPRLKRHPDYTTTISGTTYTFLAPGDLATIYNINPLYQASPAIDGTGQKMVVVGQTDLYLADLNDFRSGFGLSTIPSSSTSCAPSATSGEVGVITAPCNTTNFEYIVSGTGSDPGLSPGDLSESDLDIEWSGSIARNAQIIFVTSKLGVDDSASWAIDNQLAPVISESYGLCEALNTAPSIASQDVMYQKAASLGISFFAAAGDAAAATCDGDASSANVESAVLGPSVSYPASSPEVTGVGGTEFNEGTAANPTYWAPPPTNSSTNFGASALKYIPELAWNDTATSVGSGFGLDGTGGGPSNCVNVSGSTTTDGYPINICDAPPGGGFTKPSYQTGITPADSVRDVPDISFSASNLNDSYIVCAPQSEVVGNSSSTSTCASGISNALSTYLSAFGGTSASTPVAAGIAVLLNQYLGTNGLGNINPQIYALYGTSASSFHDITTGTSTITGDTSDNVVPCTSGTPSFEPSGLRCPTSGTLSFGYSVTGGHVYSRVAGLGSLDVNNLATAWAASRTSSSITITPSATNVTTGTSVSFAVVVTPSSGVGTVSFSTLNGGTTTVLGTATLNAPYPPSQSGTVTFTTTALPAGTNSVTATYEGDAALSGSSSAVTTVTVTIPFSLSASQTALSVPAGQPASTVITVTPLGGFSQTVNFNSASSPAGGCTAGLPTGATCTFSPSAVTLASGPQTVTLTINTAANMALATGAPITVSATTGSTVIPITVGLTVTATNQTFSISSTASTYSVAPGATASVPISVTGTNGFVVASSNTTALPVSYSCIQSTLPSEVSCSFSPSSGQSVSATAVTLNILTTAPTAQLRKPIGRRSGIFYAALLPGLFGIFFAAGSRTRRVRLLSLIMVLGFSTLWLGSCSSGGGNNTQTSGGTPAGTYAIKVNATTAGPNAVTSTPLTINLTVQ